MRLRKARLSDAGEIHALMQPFVHQGSLLPRSLGFLCQNVRNFSVIEDEHGRILASGALRFLDEDIAEVQSLVVLSGRQGGGLGRRLVAALLAEAREHQVMQVIALTHTTDFFLSLGFTPANRDDFPQKFSADCVNCPKLRNCRQMAVAFEVFPARVQPVAASATVAARAGAGALPPILRA